ncbi:MAG: tRNA (adenosine(37)-N6)-dimethylallyltransferase MiaA [Candidatus Izemoplasmatales bacterium]|jgi:tRNA dimethylallyltransferase|nr:tRNA (adenosine(37)-N6)-dimethylallyltransferase MiaA [Candidatus Izemoplasmatales bacterium]
MIPLIVIVGPTSVGKTALSLHLAEMFHGEIISADSMQFYKGLNIGTAKIQSKDMQGIKHHLIDILEPTEEFSVADYQKLVRNKIDELIQNNIPVILVGGSGLFLQSVLYQYEFDGQKRQNRTNVLYEAFTNEDLYELLKKTNPTIALTVHPNNRRRLLRSIEIAESKADSYIDKGKILNYQNTVMIGLEMERTALYSQINQRVDDMIDAGLIEEAKGLYDRNIHGQSSMAIGYKELYAYFDGLCTLEEAINIIKMQSRRFSKRQMTWFKNKMDVEWYEVVPEHLKETIELITSDIQKKVRV